MKKSTEFFIFICIVKLACSSSVSRADYGEIKLFQTPVSYSVESTVLLNDASRRDKEVSYKVKAALDVHPVWTESDVEFILKFELRSPQLYSRGKHVSAEYASVKSIWDSYSSTAFYAHWKHGIIQEAYLDPTELIDIQNFKRSLISLFQFQVVDGEDNETDVSGNCKVQYESTSMQVIRKFKTQCQAEGWALDEEGGEEVQSRRVTRYTLSAALDALDEVYGEELHVLGEEAWGAGLKARAWLQLRRDASASVSPSERAASRASAVPSSLSARALPVPPPAALLDLLHPPSNATELQAAVQEALEARGAEAGRGGTVADARASLRLRAALRRPSPSALAALDALLHDGADPALLDTACAALGQADSAAAHAAAARFLRLRHGDVAPRPARAYLAALALAPRAPPAALKDAARLGDAGDAALRDAALLAAGAASRRAPADAARSLRDQLAASLARCKDDDCRRVRVLAIGNMQRADAADLLLEQAERGAPAVALAALDALEALPGEVLQAPARLRRLERLALESRPLETRAAALDLLLRLSAQAPFALPRALLALRSEPAPAPLRRLAWQRLRSLAAAHAPVRSLLALLPLQLRAWDEQAQPGTSSVLEREVFAAGEWRGLLDSVQLERNGALRRGAVRLRASGPSGLHDVLGVELWTRGLEAFTGASAGDEGDAEPMSGGLSFAVGGVRLPGITLFSGQAELLAHVWAGTGSEPTPALRASPAPPPARAALALLGGAPLLYSRDAALSLALDAQAQVSLWSRSARTQLRLRGALAARAEARVGAAWGELSARAATEAEPRLDIAADLDFYDGVSLCVRVSAAELPRGRNGPGGGGGGGGGGGVRGVRRARSLRWRWSGRTLSLGAPNDAACRSLGAAD